MQKKGPYLFAEIVHASKKADSEKEKLLKEIEERRKQRAYDARVRFAKNVIYTIAGLAGVMCIFALMLICALGK